MKKLSIGLVLATLLLGCMQLSTEDIAKQMQEKYEKMKDMKGTMVLTTEFQGEKQIYVLNFSYKKPDKWRSEDENSITVSNGSVMWRYNKQMNEVVITELPKTPEKPEFDYGKIVKDMLDKYEIKLIGEENIGRDCYVIEAKPKEETFLVKQKLWIDKEFWYPIKIETNFGEFNSTIEYRDVEFNSGISDKEFEFVVPESAKVVEKEFKLPEKLTIEEAQQRVNFTIIKPKYTAGYEFSHAMVLKFAEKESVSLYYKKGEGVFTVTESTAESKPMPNTTKVKIKDKEGEIAEMFGVRMLRFNANGIEIAISGELSKEELIKIAESMV